MLAHVGLFVVEIKVLPLCPHKLFGTTGGLVPWWVALGVELA